MNIAIIDNDENSLLALAGTLAEAGHTAFVLLATDQHRVSIVSKVRLFGPDIVLIAHDLGFVDGHAVASLLHIPKEKIIGLNPGASDQYCGKVFGMKSRVALDPHEEDEVMQEAVRRNRERLVALVKEAAAA